MGLITTVGNIKAFMLPSQTTGFWPAFFLRYGFSLKLVFSLLLWMLCYPCFSAQNVATDKNSDTLSKTKPASNTKLVSNTRLAARTLLLDIVAYDNIMIAVGQRGHVLRSEDAGLSWALQPTPTPYTLTSVIFLDQNTLIAAGHHQTIIRSEDAGLNWQSVPLADPDSAPWLDLVKINGQQAILTGAYGYYARSEDAGKSWQLSNPTEADFHLNHIRALSDEKFLLLAETGVIYITTDAGKNWQQIEGPDAGSYFFSIPFGESDSVILLSLGGLIISGNPFAENPQWTQTQYQGNDSLWGGTFGDSDQLWLVGAAGQLVQIQNVAETAETFTSFDLTDRHHRVAALWYNKLLWTVGESGIQAFNSSGTPQALNF